MRTILLIANPYFDSTAEVLRACVAADYVVDLVGSYREARTRPISQLTAGIIVDVDSQEDGDMDVTESFSDLTQFQTLPVIALSSLTYDETTYACRGLNGKYLRKGAGLGEQVVNLLAQSISASKALTEEPEIEEDDDDYWVASSDICDTVFAMLGLSDEGEETFWNNEPAPGLSQEPWVLSVEDDDDFALSLRMRLGEMGLKVARSAEGRDGYRRAFVDSPKAIILDYELPQGNGDYVLRRLKETPATRDIPVIVLTGRKEAHIERQMRGLGAFDFLTKPVEWQRLRSALQSCMGSEVLNLA